MKKTNPQKVAKSSSAVEAEAVFAEKDSLSLYVKKMREGDLLSPEEELTLMQEYSRVTDRIWDNLTEFGFVANEYLNILEDISPENIRYKFMVLDFISKTGTRPESLLVEFMNWKEQISNLYSSMCVEFKKSQSYAEKIRTSISKLLKKYRPQNSFIEEWLQAAIEYKRLIDEDSSEHKKSSREQVLQRLLMPVHEFEAKLKNALEQRILADSIRQKILEANLRLVVSVAKRYQNSRMALNDLIQEGNIGLMKALEKFDCRLGHRFSTYATWWIKQSISRAIAEQSRTIRIPSHMIATITRMQAEEQVFIQEKGREPVPEELASILDMPKERVRALQKMASQTISLQAPAGNSENSTLEDFIEDENSENPVQKAAFSVLKEKISEVLDMLSERERQIIMMRFGIASEKEKTLVELSEQFGITKERVRQIEEKALAKLRHPSRRKLLEGYF